MKRASKAFLRALEKQRAAQAIEAQRAATPKSDAVEDESAVRQDAPKPSQSEGA